METNGLTPESEIFTPKTQRKNEADFDSDRKRKTAPLETTCAKLEAKGKKKPHPSTGELQEWLRPAHL
jgi:hypothetical protein